METPEDEELDPTRPEDASDQLLDEVDALRHRRAGELAVAHLHVIEPVARKIFRLLGNLVELEELISIGRTALVEAARVHDPSLSPFPAYASLRIRWAILDNVRRGTHGRSAALRARALGALDRVSETTDANAPVAPTEEAHLERFRDALSAHAAALFVGIAATDWSPKADDEPAESPEESLMAERRTAALKKALAGFDKRSREVIERHYFGGERFDAIAESLNLSKSWVSRIHGAALEKLGKKLREH